MRNMFRLMAQKLREGETPAEIAVSLAGQLTELRADRSKM